MAETTYISPSHRGTCSECGKAVYLSRSRPESQRCRECQRANPRPRAIPKNPAGIHWTCELCGAQCSRGPVRGQVPRFCGDRCQRRAALARRYASRGTFSVPDAMRQAIHERDGWTCRICGEPTSLAFSHGDPWSPTLDHIEPRSAALIPDDTERNLRTAHWACNQLRGAAARTDDEVRALVLAKRREVA